MKRLIRLKQAVIVEGKYDKIALENVIDAVIIPTNGFGIFKDSEKRDIIRNLAKKNGIVVMTDSDSAGAVIRAYIKKIAAGAEITNVYVPSLRGKERRKSKPSAEGILGVEGMSPEIIEEALKRSNVGTQKTENKRKITKCDMFSAGLSGGANSSKNRKSFLSYLELPCGISSSAMLDLLNGMFSYEEFKEKVSEWQKNTDIG